MKKSNLSKFGITTIILLLLASCRGESIVETQCSTLWIVNTSYEYTMRLDLKVEYDEEYAGDIEVLMAAGEQFEIEDVCMVREAPLAPEEIIPELEITLIYDPEGAVPGLELDAISAMESIIVYDENNDSDWLMEESPREEGGLNRLYLIGFDENGFSDLTGDVW